MEQRYISTLSSTSALDGVGDQRHAPAALPPEKSRYPLYRRLGGPQQPVWTGAENLAPTGIWSPDRKALASRCTDWARPAHIQVFSEVICNMWFFCHDYNRVAAHPSRPIVHEVDTHYLQLVHLKTYIVNPNHQEAFLKHTRRRYSMAIPCETCPLKHHVSPTINNDVLVSRDLP